MTSSTNLKVMLEAQIDEIISSLDLRINLNAQTLVPLNSKKLTESQSSLGSSPNLKAIHAQNKMAEFAIDECYEAINKLLLIKFFIDKTDFEILLHLLNNYNFMSFDEIYRGFNKPIAC